MNAMLRLLAVLVDFVPEGSIDHALTSTARVKLSLESLTCALGVGEALVARFLIVNCHHQLFA